jgi:hypothetical protein
MKHSPKCMGVWQGVAMDSLKFHPGPLCLTLLRPAGRLPLKQHYGCFRSGPPAGRATCGRLLPVWTPHAIRLCLDFTRFPFTHRQPKFLHLGKNEIHEKLFTLTFELSSMPCRRASLACPTSRVRKGHPKGVEYRGLCEALIHYQIFSPFLTDFGPLWSLD